MNITRVVSSIIVFVIFFFSFYLKFIYRSPNTNLIANNGDSVVDDLLEKNRHRIEAVHYKFSQIGDMSLSDKIHGKLDEQ